MPLKPQKTIRDYLKVKRKLFLDQLSQILSEIDQNYNIKLSAKQFVTRYFQYILECNERKLRGDTSEFVYEMGDYFKDFNLKYFFPKQIWQFSVTKTLINSLQNASELDILHIFILLNLVLQGKFAISSASLIEVLPYEGGYTKYPFEYDYMIAFRYRNLVKIVIQIIPVLYPILNEEGNPKHFEFHHELILVGSIPDIQKDNYQEIDKYFRNQQTSPNYFPNMKLVKEQKGDAQVLNEIKIGENPKNWKDLMHPRKFELILLDGNDYVYNPQFKRWISVSTQDILNKKLQKMQAFSANHYLIQKYSKQPSAFQLFKIIQNIPNFKVNLTKEQQEIISFNGDGLVIGRSGTGKTTCALLRLFTTDILFKIRSKLDQINYQTSEIQLNQQQQDCELKTVFVTASPLLACQVKRLYDRLISSIQDVINKKKNRQRNQVDIQVQGDQDEIDQSTFQIIDAIKNDQEQQEQQQQNQEDDIDDQDIDEYEKEMGEYQRFSDINQFPIFLTLRKFIFLVDGSLMNSFFAVFDNKQNRGSQWHNEQFGQMSISQINEAMQKKLEQYNQKLMDEIDNSDFIQTKMHEVTQNVFVRIFWPKIVGAIKSQFITLKFCDPIFVWSEICTKIKGHETSHKYPDKYIDFDNYKNLSGLNKDECSFIYEAFQIYEQYKYQLGYYDLLDLVNHINQELANGNDFIENVHYLLLDELQDVPRAVLILLDQLTELGLFCCGDNAQNIAKGIGYRFFEVQNCLLSTRNEKKKTYRNLKIFDLSINFRSHNQILQLANSVIRMIEIFFPQKIDKLNKETSNLQGPKPIIIKSDDVGQLLNNLCDFFSNDKNTVEFGCNQVIIVKDQESKTRLPIELQNVLCLTIYEAKGLEFDDVILFNFFHDSTASIEDWQSLNDLEPYSEHLKKIDYERFITIHQNEVIQSTEGKDNELVQVWQLKMKKKVENYTISIDLCQELKQLYVAITRPKNRLIIFDQSSEKRRNIQNIWIQLDTVNVIGQQVQPKDVIFQLESQNNNKENWKRQGLKMFRMNNYDQAAKSFKFAEEKVLEKKSIAYNIVANNAHVVNDNLHLFQEAAMLFEEIGLFYRAAQCYFTAKQFEKAQDLYEKIGKMNEMAESAYFARNYSKAAQTFEILGDIRRAIDCYRLIRDWDNVIIILNKYKDQFSQKERMAFLNQFFPNYLQSLALEIEETGVSQNESNQVQEIQETNTQGELVLNQSDSFTIQNSVLNRSENQGDSQLVSDQINNQNQNESSLEILNIEQDEQSQSQSFQIENQDENEQNMDHLSIFDPDDEWLLQDQKSLIKSMSSKISHQSEFSNIILLNQPPQISLLKQKSNIFISNKVLQKLIKKSQLFSQEFRNHLESQKCKQVQLSNRKDDDKEFDHMINFVYDLENIDIDSIYMILDILEQFKSYKLCIYLCNYFKLASYLGRYVVSLTSSYSPLTKNKSSVYIQMITLGSYRRNLLEQSALSQIAFDNIIETINPIFSTFKYEEELNLCNSLGLNFYQELIGLGFWKALIYSLNYRHSMDLCMSFNNFSDAIEIFKKMKQHKKSELSEEEQFRLRKIQYYQFIKSIKSQQDKVVDFTNTLDDVFQITKNYYMKKQKEINEVDLDQLIINANISKKNLTFNEQLKQIEAIILSFDILKSIRDFSYENFVGLFQLLEYFHDKLISYQNQENINEALLFCYGISIPKGDIMSHYSHSLFIHISSKLIKQVVKETHNKDNAQKQPNCLTFVDIGYEYISIPFEQAIEEIKISFFQRIQQMLNHQSQRLKEFYKVHDDEFFSLSSQEYWEDTLAELLVFVMLEQSIKKLQSKIKQKKEVQPISIHYSKQMESQDNSIVDSETSQTLQLIQRIILKNNFRIIETPNYIKSIVREISLGLILRKQDRNHSNMIMAINLLNLTDQLSFGVLIFSSQKKGYEVFLPYLKYIEFLECQHFGIIEDSAGCFLDYSQYVMEKFYLDEQLCHVIRIGLNILVSLLCYSQQKLTILKGYKDYLNKIENVDEQCCKLEVGVFQINNQQVILEYLEYLFEFYQYCCSNYYQDKIKQFLFIFAINLLNTQQVKVIKSLIQYLQQDEKLKAFKRLQDTLAKELSGNKKEVQHKKNILISHLSYLEEDIVEVEIVNIKSGQQLDQQYDKCIQIWNDYQDNSNSKMDCMKQLINKWNGYRKNHKINLTEQIKQNLQFWRSLQYYKIGYDRHQCLRTCVNLRDLNRNMKKHISNFNEDLQLSVSLQRQLLKERQNYINSFDIHLLNSFLNDLGEYLKELFRGEDVHTKVKQLEVEFRNWKENKEEDGTYQKMMELNRQLIVQKWKNLKGGVKVHHKGRRDQLTTIQEEVTDEFQQ
ncbi:unnamed protein product (macronuclear) [Paramecium tetraurelia]|uniref:UvrD-like helicase C-terminal domain-containing protein n=1 Tax=Paramecium tetraurelia TaxID=5888 RepID=A0BNC3_PARTE|nr:uncharacterized protein GSPATT00030678001 [Paramecium tetraurelia]CAK60040.1 unnamed protein product [Paramecium tetraurelia]|eukprot:XP_001427438.1 hypothetical protein (macronuclear) [Paramecium tetraurelia strain d4-2]